MRRHCARHHQRSEDSKTVSAACCSTGGNQCRARKAVVEGKRRCTDCWRRSRRRCAESGCRCRNPKLMKTVRMVQATPTMKAMRGRIVLQKHCVRKVSKSSFYFAEALGVRARHRAALTILFLAIALGLCAEELPRKAKTSRETYPGADVIYDSVTTPDGKRLRTIITKPRDAKGKVPVIFVAGWLSCDSVEAPAGTKDESGLVFRGLAQLPEFALFRMDKQGVGDSEGVCAETDFESELAGYRAAF